MMWWVCAAALAKTWTVPADFATVADAVQAAKDGDTIVISGTVTESVVVDEDLVLQADPTKGAVWIPGATTALEIAGKSTVEVVGIEFDGVKTQRLLFVAGSPTVVFDGITVRNGASAVFGGGLVVQGDADVTVRDSVFADNAGADGAHVQLEFAERVVISDTTFTGGDATGSGGAVLARNMPVGTLQIVRSWFQGNTAGASGGAVHLEGVIQANLDANLFCDNSASADGGAVSAEANTLGVAIGNVFMENLAVGFGGALFAGSGSFTTTNNHFVANTTQSEGAAIYSAVGGSHLNDLFAHNVAEKDGLAAFFDSGGLLRLDYAALFANAPNGSTVLAPNRLTDDPRFEQWGNDPCEPEDLRLMPNSPLVDAGDPGILDFDGTPSDIGAFGGPTPFPLDIDEDGSPIPFDCDDADPEVFPGAEERCNGIDDDCDGSLPPEEADSDQDNVALCEGDCDDTVQTTFPGAPERAGDGIDQDCDGGDLCFIDEDGDGVGTDVTAVGTDLECTGEALSSSSGDCNDSDPTVAPGAMEIECNEIDDDCDVSTPDCPSNACGCANTDAHLGWAWLAVGLLAWRRRRW